MRVALRLSASPNPLLAARPTAIGITMGIMMAKVPQEVPVAKAMSAERMNTIAGTRASGNPPPTTTSERKDARPSPPSSGDDLMIVPMDQAITRITRAGTIDLIPLMSASDASLILKRPRQR